MSDVVEMPIPVKAERPGHVPADRVYEFDLYSPPNVEQDFFAAWKRLQAPGVPEVVWTPYNGGHWIPTRADLVRQVFSDHERFSSRVIGVPKHVFEKVTVIPAQVDPPQHRPYRKLLNDNLGTKVVKQKEDEIRAIAIDLIEGFRARGKCEFTKEFAEFYPIRVFMALVELPVSDLPELKSYVDGIIHTSSDEHKAASFQALDRYIRPYVEARKDGDGTDMLSNMINQTVDGQKISIDEGCALGVQVLIAGVDTVVNFVSFVMHFFARNPEYRQQLIDDSALIPRAVEELFRRFSIVTMSREIRNDIEFGGVQLKQGEMILVPSMLVGLDETVNKCPMDVDFRRTGAEHAAFGQGIHTCPGMHFARREVRIMLEEWLARIPEFSIPEGTEIRFIGGVGGSLAALPLEWPVH